MRRRIVPIIALLVTWASCGLVLQTLFSREQDQCARFNDLSAECFAPFGLAFIGLTVLFLLATLTLAVLAARTTSRSGNS